VKTSKVLGRPSVRLSTESARCRRRACAVNTRTLSKIFTIDIMYAYARTQTDSVHFLSIHVAPSPYDRRVGHERRAYAVKALSVGASTG
jgi:hypothetical protein